MRLFVRVGIVLFLALSTITLTGCVFLYQMPRGPELTAVQSSAIGKSSFVMHAYEDTDRVTIRIRTYRPPAWNDGDKILFVMHGAGRNAEDYLDAWIDHAEATRTLVVAPEFASPFSRFITNDYQEGNLFTYFGSRNPKGEWAFAVVENAFDYIVEHNGLSNTGYDIFGHSAGSQFIQRMVMLMPDARIGTAIAANAGTYTFPESNVDYPYGLNGLERDSVSLQQSFAARLVILLGELDNTADQGILDQSSKAMAQGDHRLDRGKHLFSASKNLAEVNGYGFNWELHTVPGVGHNFREMSDNAARILAR